MHFGYLPQKSLERVSPAVFTGYKVKWQISPVYFLSVILYHSDPQNSLLGYGKTVTFQRFQLAPYSKAPSTRIRKFLNPQLFLSGFKNFPVHTKRI